MNKPELALADRNDGEAALPARIADVAELEEILSRPDAATAHDLATLDGDLLILGATGKIGPTIARMARRAAPDKRVIGVARFADPASRKPFEDLGIETIPCDLMDREAIARLPRAKNLLFLVGHKFGSSGNQGLTWAVNTQLAGIVADIHREARIVAFSTGCVYPFVPIESGGADESMEPDAPGEYAQSCVGRERLLEHFSRLYGNPGRLIRLNYAIDLRYGVLYDIAAAVHAGRPVDLRTGHVNVIWQGDVARWALRAFRHVTAPTSPLNVSGPETLSVRWLAGEFARRMGKEARFEGEPAATAWLNNSGRAFDLFGYPSVPIVRMLDWIADWVARDMPSLNKPTKFESRNARY
jgi:nucleoside-diphosphate-sugar epimerase